MKTLKILFVSFLVICMTSCYEEFIFDFDCSTAGFSMAHPLRTVIADRDMEIFVGVSIGGKREVDTKDWANFEIFADSVPSNYTLLPSNYYTFSDPNTMRVRKGNLPVADVGIKFTEDFYNDVKATGKYYVLPLRITKSSLDSITKAVTIVGIKFISTFHGTYYIKGKFEERNINTDTLVRNVVYSDNDLTKNITRNILTISRNVIVRPGLANFNETATERVQLTIEANGNKDKTYNVLVQQATGGINITDGSGTYYGDKEQPEIKLNYTFTRGTSYFKVEETLILRQDPLYDFRVETW